MEGRPGGRTYSSASSSVASKKSTLEWGPLQKHPVFCRESPFSSLSLAFGGIGGGSSNLMAWDAASSRLYLWDHHSRCLHRLTLRFTDPHPASSSPALVEAASPSEILMTDIQIQFVVHHISLNVDGSSLLLAGSEGLSLMHLYERASPNDDTITCRTILVGSQIFSGRNNGLQTLQVSWHPYSSSHLGILSSDSVFRLFDLSADMEQPEQEFYLQPVEPGKSHNPVSLCPVAFSFGGQHLWERFSVFVLFSDGSVYILCPVVPFGSLCSLAYIEEIYEDVNAFGLESLDAKVVSNSNLAIAWLEATFPELAEKSMEGGDILVSRARPYAPLDASLSLQGPLGKVCHGEENDDSKFWKGDSQGRAVSFLYSSIGKDSLLVVAWHSGQLHIDALADEVQPLWNFGSSPHLRVDSYGRIKGVAMICESNLQEVSTANLSHPLRTTSNPADSVWLGHPPPLLRLANVDLALPKHALDNCQLSLFSDPLVSERFYSLHGWGIDLITLHFLPSSNLVPETEEIEKAPSVYPILSTCHEESCSEPVLVGFITIADSFGHSQIIGLTPTYECIVLEIKGWNEIYPFQYDNPMKSVGPTQAVIPEIISKEILSGPKVIVIPPSTTLRSMTADSIEGRSTLHHYIKLFHENYVEYAHKVYIELQGHGDYLKMTLDDQHKRLYDAKQLLLNVEAKQPGIEDRMNRALKVYELLEQRLQSFKMLPGANKKPLSTAEREFKAQLDSFADVELDALRSSIETLNTRLRRCIQSSPNSAVNAARRAPGRRTNHMSDSLIRQLKSSLGILTNINNENTKKVKLIDHELKSREE